MFIRAVDKKNKKEGKAYRYYRLIHSYRVGDKTRQQVLLNLGSLEELPREKHKLLADKIEELITGTRSMFQNTDKQIDVLAKRFSSEIIKKRLFPLSGKLPKLGKEGHGKWEEVDLSSIDMEDSREVGGAWLCKQAFEKAGLSQCLSEIGFDETEATMAMVLIAAKMLHPSSELETERWLQNNTKLPHLFGLEPQSINRYLLYKTAIKLYEGKEMIEDTLYKFCSGLFSNHDNIIIYDLTNMYFEGRMQGSGKAMFGRSKEKRNDCRLIGLSLAIDSMGFLRYSQLYPGNISEPSTLKDVLGKIKGKLPVKREKPVVTMDAGIATDENLFMLKQEGYDYVCVSRSKPKEYLQISPKVLFVEDNTGGKIEIEKVFVEGYEDTFLRVKSEKKTLKESSMDEKLTQRFEERLEYLKQGLLLPRRLKKITAVHEHVGRLKDQYSKVAKYYQIDYLEDHKNGLVKDISWERKKEKEKPKGEYFLRYSRKKLTESEIWDVYNLTREMEAIFRCLKNDLDIRPIFHQKDKYIEPHIWMGLLAYQIVNYIRLRLKDKGINHGWSKISTIMQTQQCATVSINAKECKKVYARVCSRPNGEAMQIYEELGWRHRPYTRKLNVVTQL
ncbi:MAG TPA: IS1634 family transposase [Bacteroidales bacterium]|nr:IS1634 family transposase [Bacteroidales bacterium]